MPAISGKRDEDDEMGHESPDSDKSDADDMETDSGMDEEHSDDISGKFWYYRSVFANILLQIYASCGVKLHEIDDIAI